MKINRPLLISMSILAILFFVTIIYKKKPDPEIERREFYNRIGARLSIKVDSIRNCDEKVVKGKFSEWMDSYYPDWKIIGKVKIFKPQSSEGSYIISDKCSYNIRFQTVNPHIASIAPDLASKSKEIIIVRFQYSNDYSSYHLKTIRGVLY